MAPAGPADIERKSITERGLSVLAEVQAGEGAGLLLLGLNAFLLLTAYYIVRPVRNALILTEFGAEDKAYAAAGQAVLLLGVIPLYGALASRVSRIGLITWVTLFFTANLAVFYLFGVAGAREGIAFYLWVGIFNVLILSMFWAFANDLYSEPQGKRLFAIVMLCANLGALAGAQAEVRLIRVTGPYGLMLISASLLLCCILVSRLIHRRAAADAAHFLPRAPEAPLEKTGALELLLRDRYLMLIAGLMVLVNVVNSSGEYLLGVFVLDGAVRAAGADVAAQKALVGEFYGGFDTMFTIVGIVLQMFAVSRIFRYVGVRGALFFLPALALTGYSFVLFLPLLAVVRWVKVFENATDYSVQNTTRRALFLVVNREAKYKAQAAIDTFFQRGGDVLAAAVVYAGTNWLALTVPGFAAINVGLTLVWIGVAWGIARQHRRRAAEQPTVVPPGAAVAQGGTA